MITVVTGPPCSGKSTWVRKNAKPGDIVIDFDVIAQALGSPEDHDHDPQLREITAAGWAGAVRRALTGHHGTAVWIIDARPHRDRLQAYQRQHARIVAMAAPRDELHRRAGDDKYRRKAIDEWLADTATRNPAPAPRTAWLQPGRAMPAGGAA